jgi:hypothetical protein
MLLTINSCNITYTGKINQKKIEKYFGQNNLNGTININELSKLLNEKSKDTSNLMFIDSILTFQNIAFFFDSTGYVKDLVGSNYFKKNLESISLAIGYYNYDRPITIPTAQNRLPQKLRLHFNDLSSIVNIQYSKEIKDSNKILVFIAPNQTNRVYLKTMKSFRVNWKKIVEKDNFILLFIKE